MYLGFVLVHFYIALKYQLNAYLTIDMNILAHRRSFQYVLVLGVIKKLWKNTYGIKNYGNNLHIYKTPKGENRHNPNFNYKLFQSHYIELEVFVISLYILLNIFNRILTI